MIPIACEETPILIEKAEKLLQSLIDLKKGLKKSLPAKIEECIVESTAVTTTSKGLFLVDVKKFIKKIGDYIRITEYDIDEIETIRTIAEAYPEFLATTRYGELPILGAVRNKSTCSIFIPLLADIGRRHGVGGEEARGGLLNLVGGEYNVLDEILYLPSTVVFDTLRSAEPPLFCKEDVRKYNLLHKTRYDDMHMVKYMIDLDPSCIYQYDHQDNLPIYYDFRHKKKTEYIIQRSISYDPSNDTEWGLFAKVDGSEDKSLCNFLVTKFGADKAWDSIEAALSRFDGLPILHQVIQYDSKHCANVMSRFPDSVFIRDSNNRLPIHVALEKGMKWSSELVAIMNINQGYLGEADPVTSWPPFVLARAGDLRTIYHLLRKHPEHIERDTDGSFAHMKL
jgi:hypothetical protein